MDQLSRAVKGHEVTSIELFKSTTQWTVYNVAMQAILHIGTEKTGSTALQNFLAQNTAFLEDNKLIYPELGFGSNHRVISALAFDQYHQDDFTRKHRLESKRRRAALAKKIRQNLATITATKNVNSAIISSEHFQSRLTTDAELARLKNFLEDVGFTSFKIVVYLREQVALAQSLYSTWLINGGKTSDSPPWPLIGEDGDYFDWICDHERTIKRFANTFGLANINPYLFDPLLWHNGNLVHDFLKHLSVSVDPSCFFPKWTNGSATARGLQIIKEINSLIPLDIDGKNNLARRYLSQEIRDHFTTGGKFYMREDLVLKYQEHYSKSNNWVRQTFFPTRKQLFENPTVHPIQNLQDSREIALFIASLWSKQYGPNRNKETTKSLIKNGLRLLMNIIQ